MSLVIVYTGVNSGNFVVCNTGGTYQEHERSFVRLVGICWKRHLWKLIAVPPTQARLFRHYYPMWTQS